MMHNSKFFLSYPATLVVVLWLQLQWTKNITKQENTLFNPSF